MGSKRADRDAENPIRAVTLCEQIACFTLCRGDRLFDEYIQSMLEGDGYLSVMQGRGTAKDDSIDSVGIERLLVRQ